MMPTPIAAMLIRGDSGSDARKKISKIKVKGKSSPMPPKSTQASGSPIVSKARAGMRGSRSKGKSTPRPVEASVGATSTSSQKVKLRSPAGTVGKWSDLKTVKLDRQDLKKIAAIIRASVIREALKEYAKRGINPSELKGLLQFKVTKDGVMVVLLGEDSGESVGSAAEKAKAAGGRWIHPASRKNSFVLRGFKAAKADIDALLIFRTKQALRSRKIL